MSEFPKWPLVYVEWEDSCGGSSWLPIAAPVTQPPSMCRSVGWLAQKSKRALTLYADIERLPSNQYPHANREMTIPMGCVKRIVTLRKARR